MRKLNLKGVEEAFRGTAVCRSWDRTQGTNVYRLPAIPASLKIPQGVLSAVQEAASDAVGPAEEPPASSTAVLLLFRDLSKACN